MAGGTGSQAPVPPSSSAGRDAGDRSDRSPPAAHLRRFLSRHARTNGIDADTLARLPLFHPAGVRPLERESREFRPRVASDRDRSVRASRYRPGGSERQHDTSGARTPAWRWSDRLAQRHRAAGHLHDPEHRTRPARLLFWSFIWALAPRCGVGTAWGVGMVRIGRDAPSPASQGAPPSPTGLTLNRSGLPRRTATTLPGVSSSNLVAAGPALSSEDVPPNEAHRRGHISH